MKCDSVITKRCIMEFVLTYAIHVVLAEFVVLSVYSMFDFRAVLESGNQISIFWQCADALLAAAVAIYFIARVMQIVYYMGVQRGRASDDSFS